MAYIESPNVKLTNEGGLAIKFINKTGAASVKGTIVEASSVTPGAFTLVQVGAADPFGIVYENGIEDGSACWVVVSGIADVFFIGNTVLEHFARVTVVGDTGNEAGKAISEAVPTSPFATDKHFLEIGHVIEARTGAGLAKCVLHFN